MFGSSLPPVVCLIYVILLCVFTFLVLCCDVRFVFTSSCLSYLGSPIMCLYVLSSVLWCPLRFPHKSHVRFAFTSSCLSYLRYPIMCLYVPCSVLWCSVRFYLQSFVLFTFSYYVSLRSVFCVVMFGSSLPPVVCLIYVLLLCVFTFRVLCCDVRFVFTSSCLSYLGSPIMCLYVLSSVLWCPLRFPHKNDVRFVFISSAVVCLIYVICVCLRIVVSNTYCVAFLLCFSSSCVLYVASFSGLSIFDCHFGIL
jgi:hypothetical protein